MQCDKTAQARPRVGGRLAHSLTDIATEIYLDISESSWVRRSGIIGPKYSFRAFESAVRASELYSTSTTIREKWRTFVAKGIFTPVEEGLYGQVIVDAAAWNRGLPRAPALRDPAEDHTQTNTHTNTQTHTTAAGREDA